ncbi:MAG: CAP domain-containing protein [Coleofasciculaceae cyanobacterium SM2_1_6]|nr:CAP domain-containing protein [Coleofasciculaceae cyanobacterium SM2_1_6]
MLLLLTAPALIAAVPRSLESKFTESKFTESGWIKSKLTEPKLSELRQAKSLSVGLKQAETIIPPFGTLPVTPPRPLPQGGWVSSIDGSPPRSAHNHAHNFAQNYLSFRDRKPEVVSAPVLERLVHQQVNQFRRLRNLPALALDERISQQARLHSQRMANGSVPFSHQGFEQRGRSIELVITNQGISENVAYNQGYADPIAEALQGWIASEGHRQNLEGQFDLTGIGVAQNSRGQFFFTQIFVRR